MRDYLILRYFVSCLFVTDMVSPVYEKHYPRDRTPASRGREDPGNSILSPHKARQIIESQNMVKVCENEHGTIWKLPEE